MCRILSPWLIYTPGANHRQFMQDIFEKMPNVTIRNINEIE